MAVKSRTVFYISGFDPNGARWYHKLYREEAAKQAAVSSLRLDVGRWQEDGDHSISWDIEADDNGHSVRTRYRFLCWDDIIRNHWPTAGGATYALAFSNPWNFLRRGVLTNVYRTAWPTFLCGMLPTIFFSSAALAVLAGCVVLAMIGASLTDISIWLALMALLLPGGYLLFKFMASLDQKLRLHWLSRVYAFNLVQAERTAEGLAERTRHFARLIVDEVNRGETDEVLIVAHSTGCQLTVSVMAEALQDLPAGRMPTLMTIGGSIPMLAWDEEADWFRQDLRTVAECAHLPWLDFSAAQDGACFALRNPAALVLPDHPETERPKVLSIKLADRLPKERIREIYWDKFAIHFQYLMASEQPAEYDYFAITAGAMTLQERFSQRPTTVGFTRLESKMWPRRRPSGGKC